MVATRHRVEGLEIEIDQLGTEVLHGFGRLEVSVGTIEGGVGRIEARLENLPLGRFVHFPSIE